MSASQPDAAARVIERLLVDPGFRADFRRDPATACREAGLHELADEMSVGAGKAMHTLDMRESRSSLAGVMMAAALEGIGVFEFVEHIVPGVASAPAAVHDVLSRVNLPAVDGARGALAASPAPGGGAGAGAGATDAAVADPAAAAPAQAAAAPVQEPAPMPAHQAGAQAATEATKPSAAGAGQDGAPADGSTAAGPASADTAAPSSPVDPVQLGAAGTGGPPNAEALALLDNKKVILDADGIADVKEGRIDPRVVAVLTKLSEKHTIQVSCMCRDHPTNTLGGSVSNHHFGRGMDIASIDGQPVNAGNPIARDIATELGSLDPNYRPDEIGTPWQIADPRYFHDSDHNDHIHVGFKQLLVPDWKPPADVAAGATGAGAADGAAAASGAGTPAAGGGTLTLGVAGHASGHAAGRRTLGIAAVAERPAGDAQAAGAAALRGAAEHIGKGATPYGESGPRAASALREALRYKGTPYHYGGSTPKTGFDCSGLVQWVYAKQGIRIPRVTDQQILASNGTQVARGQLHPGDLVFFKDPTGYVHHVGISMGGAKFLHAPHTGDVVKESSLKESYYAQQFAGGRRFDNSAPDAVAAPAPQEIAAAQAAHARDAADAQRPHTLTFKALSRQEAGKHGSTIQFLEAVRPEDAPGGPDAGAVADHIARAAAGPLDYPGDDAPKTEIAAWMGRRAQAAGLPPELPVMAGLVESVLHNVQGGDRDSVGYFQMRVGTWNNGPYVGYATKPELQLKWFIDQATAVKQQRLARGESAFLEDHSKWGEWVADIERPQENLRYKYQDQLAMARKLLGVSV
jgi:cell wall-associated NlpC family hydrolase